jgi:hypothetical protein
MASNKPTKEYGVLVAPIGGSDDAGGKFMSKKTFFAQLEAQYPSGAGWYVSERSVEIGTGEAILMAYHMERDLA